MFALGDDAYSQISDAWSTDVVVDADSEYGGREEGAMAAAAAANAGGALPDIVPGAPPDFPRLDLIAEESLTPSVIEERYETWSVDVIASDSEMEQRPDERLQVRRKDRICSG